MNVHVGIECAFSESLSQEGEFSWTMQFLPPIEIQHRESLT
jgi:hypothetical protein